MAWKPSGREVCLGKGTTNITVLINKLGGLFTSILDHVYLALSSDHYNGYFTLTHGNCAHPTVNGREVASLSSHCECINTKEQQLSL